MSLNGGSQIFYPQVTSLPAQSEAPSERELKKKPGTKAEFDRILDQNIDLNQIGSPLKFSSHAAQRVHERDLKFSPETMTRVHQAVDQAASKGIEDTLILTDEAALIVSVKNRTIVTAMDRNSLSGNVFTNIDGAVVV